MSLTIQGSNSYVGSDAHGIHLLSDTRRSYFSTNEAQKYRATSLKEDKCISFPITIRAYNLLLIYFWRYSK